MLYTCRNGAAAPLFYVLVTSTLAGRFSRNLLYVAPKASVELAFLVANETGTAPAPTAAMLKASISMDWYNRL